MKRFLLVPGLLLLFTFLGRAQQQEQTDSLVRLLSAQKMEQVEKNGQSYRKVIGPARFLHNNTYLICDTAFWNMNTSVIECIDNVSIIQEETKLTSDKLIYLIDDDLAQFRGSLVQLEDKDGNLLRTRHLDYNTKDSVATFLNGGSMKDKDGQIIESRTGIYESKIKLFTFNEDVNMYTDSVFIKTTNLRYFTETGMAYFGVGTNAWKEDNMLSSDAGWYDRRRDLFLFMHNVHGMNNTQEMWADSLYYNRVLTEVELLGEAQVSDTTRNAHSMAGRMVYVDSLSRLTLTRDPVVVGIQKEGEKVDTVYARADKMVYYTVPRCDLDSATVRAARTRLTDVNADAVAQYRKKVADEAARAATEAKKNDPNAKPAPGGRKEDSPSDEETLKKEDGPRKEDAPKKIKEAEGKSPETSDNQKDTLSVKGVLNVADSLALPPQPRDSTKIGFIRGIGNFKLFKSDLQMVSDSLEYTDLDSLVRLYKRPLVWNDKSRQYCADSLFAVIKNGTIEKANLLSEAYVIIQEDSLCFDQIRSVEMMAYFDTTGTISRFDALGDADAIFYIQEDSTYATVNFSKSKILSATFKEGGIDEVHYFDEAKSDAYPVAQITREQRELKGFNWTPQRRPKSKLDITDKELKPSERNVYSRRPKATFRETDIYFPGYISGVKDGIEKACEEKRIRNQERKLREQQLQDSLKTASALDSLTAKESVKDSLVTPLDSLTTSVKDSTVTKAVTDSVPAPKQLTEKEIKAREKELRKQEAERIRREKQERKEREWARLDSLDAAKAAAKLEAKQEKIRQKKLKQLEKLYKEQQKEDALRQKYIEYYRRKKAEEDKKAALKAAEEDQKKAAEEGRLNEETLERELLSK